MKKNKDWPDTFEFIFEHMANFCGKNDCQEISHIPKKAV